MQLSLDGADKQGLMWPLLPPCSWEWAQAPWSPDLIQLCFLLILKLNYIFIYLSLCAYVLLHAHVCSQICGCTRLWRSENNHQHSGKWRHPLSHLSIPPKQLEIIILLLSSVFSWLLAPQLNLWCESSCSTLETPFYVPKLNVPSPSGLPWCYLKWL